MVTRAGRLRVEPNPMIGLLVFLVSIPHPMVPSVQREVQALIEQHLAPAQKVVMAELAKGDAIRTSHQLPVRMKANSDPWGAMAELERYGLDTAKATAKGKSGIAGLLRALSASVDRHSDRTFVIPEPEANAVGSFMATVLSVANNMRNQSIAKLSPHDKQFLFDHGPNIVVEFGPQESLDDKTRTMLADDKRYFDLFDKQLDWERMCQCAETLALLTEPAFIKVLRNSMARAKPTTFQGVTGSVLYQRRFPQGLVLVGGPGANIYNLTEAPAILIDMGGNDSYRGPVGSGSLSILIDLGGDDVYASPSVAVGRLGAGLVFDFAGNDTYQFPIGSGGVGLAGIGLLCDMAGNDTYTGTRYTIAAALGGIGAVLDLAGNDTYKADMYSEALAGPCSVAALIDVAGDDKYTLGFKVPSGYNAGDAPSAKPGDPGYQWEAWGMGMGLGRRIYPGTPEEYALYTNAGGLGMLLDLAGKDQYQSSNFSQGCGYFFGVGLKMDLGGDDSHGAARYGHASGAHYAMGLFLDYAGKDLYTSSGPTYNCGCSWDHNPFLFIDAAGDDVYDLSKSAGPARGDIGAWGIAVDWAGVDIYHTTNMPGGASKSGLSVFYDRAEIDAYDRPEAGNHKTAPDGKGGLFVDR